MGVNVVGGETTAEADEGGVLLMSRVDKGERCAEPESEEPDEVSSPAFMITGSEDEDGNEHRYLDMKEGDGMQMASPTG